MASFLITDVRVFDGYSNLERGSVLVQDGKIAKVSTSSIEFNGRAISRPGHTLLPGLIDAHVHLDPGNESGLAQGLRFGVTTQCDLGNALFQIEKLRTMVEEGDCSDLKAAMKSATPEGGWPTPLLESKGVKLPPDENPLQTEQDGRNFVREQMESGAHYIKLLHESGSAFKLKLPVLPEIVEKSIIDEAHSSGHVVLAHAFTLEDTLKVLSLGVDGTAHTLIDQSPTDELVIAFERNNSFCNPTLTVIGSNTAEGKAMQERYAHDPRVQDLLVDGERESMCQCIAMTSRSEGSLRFAIETVKKLKENGIDVLCGTDSSGLAPGTAFGLSLHQELELFVRECGFSPTEALRSATSIPAKRLNLPDRGEIREGMRADLVLVEGDPTSDIHCTLDLRGVWIVGELCSYYKGGYSCLLLRPSGFKLRAKARDSA